ncbi:MAG: O-antigen ligase family protein [Candidatus Moraniibacteriota bacterium]
MSITTRVPLRESGFQGGFAVIPQFFLGVAFIFFPVAQLSVFGLPLYWSEAAFLGALITAPLIGWTRLSDRLAETLREEWPLLLFALLFLVGTLTAFFLNPHTVSDWGEIKSFALLPVGLLVAILVLVETQWELERLALAWLLGIVAAAIAALGAALSGWWLYDGRLAGLYQSPNYLAMLVAPGILLSLYFFRSRTRGSIRSLSVSCLILITLVLWATHSYAAWLSIGVAAAVFFWLRRPSVSFRMMLCVGLGIAGLVGGVIAHESGSAKWESLVSGSERSSLASRVMIWQAASKIATDSFPWGIGMGHFQERYLDYQRFFPPYLEWAVPTPHNLYLHFLIEGGLLTLGGWLGCVVIVAIAAWRSWQLGGRASMPWCGALGGALIVFYLTYGLVDTPYMKNDLALAVWGSLGFLAGALRLERNTIELT